MNEADARAVTLVQAFESVHPASPSWLDDDRVWATRLALQETEGRSAAAFLADRARHALQRLTEREPGVTRWMAQPLWRSRWLLWVGAAGAIAGVVADAIGSGQHINLLAPPLWGVVLWNLLVYGVLLGHLLARVLARPTRPGLWTRAVRRLLQAGRRMPSGVRGSASAAVWPSFATLWWTRAMPLTTARATALMHIGAAALGVGLIGGLYLRGLVLDYRAGWESTFLDAPGVQRLLGWAFAPARAITGQPWPDLAAFEALRGAHGVVTVATAPGVATGAISGASAAPWIHLLAVTVLIFVVVPRAVLAMAAMARGTWLSRRFPLSLDDAYVQRLLRQRRGDVARVWVLPFAQALSPARVAELPRWLTPAFGDGLQLQVGAPQAYGEDIPAPASMPPDACTHVLVWFDLATTPEDEVHGRFMHQVSQQAPAGAVTLLCVDEAAFQQRFNGAADRMSARRDLWRRFAETLHTFPVFVEVDSGAGADAGAVESLTRAVQLALRSPVGHTP